MEQETLMTPAPESEKDGTTAASTQANDSDTGSDAGGQSKTDEQKAGAPNATDEETPKGDKPKDDEAKDAPKAPEKYEFTPPEGGDLNPGVIEAFSEVARELDLTQEAAQKVIDKVAPVIAASQVEQVAALRAGWVEASKTDKEFGGDKLAENLAVAKKALEEFGSEEFIEMVGKTGLGDNPEFIRLMYRVGQRIKPDGFVPSGKAGGDPTDARALYPASQMNP